MFIETYQGVEYRDLEGESIFQNVEGTQILELGCGSRKTVPIAVGLDICPKGTKIHNVFPPGNSVADIVCDVSQKLPVDNDSQDCVIARHTLEHIVDIGQALDSWRNVLKTGGKMILALPDHDIANTIAMDNTHVHAFTKRSLRNIIDKFGFKHLRDINPNNGVSFIQVYEKL